MTDWYRTWHGAPTDPKWRTVAKRAGVRPGDVWSVVSCLFDRASQAAERGSIGNVDAEVLADALGYEATEVEAIIAALTDKGVIVNGRIAAWEKYQPKREDNSAERVAALRARQKAGNDRPPNGGGVTRRNASVTRRNAPEKSREEEKREEKEPYSESVHLTPPAGTQAHNVFDILEKRLCDAARPMPLGLNAAIAPMSQLIANGFSLELDILPAIEAAKREGKRFSTWDRMVGWVETQNAGRLRAERAKPVTKAEQIVETYQQKRERIWRQQLATWRKVGRWLQQWGPEPGDESCQIPPALIAEFETAIAQPNGATA